MPPSRQDSSGPSRASLQLSSRDARGAMDMDTENRSSELEDTVDDPTARVAKPEAAAAGVSQRWLRSLIIACMVIVASLAVMWNRTTLHATLLHGQPEDIQLLEIVVDGTCHWSNYKVLYAYPRPSRIIMDLGMQDPAFAKWYGGFPCFHTTKIECASNPDMIRKAFPVYTGILDALVDFPVQFVNYHDGADSHNNEDSRPPNVQPTNWIRKNVSDLVSQRVHWDHGNLWRSSMHMNARIWFQLRQRLLTLAKPGLLDRTCCKNGSKIRSCDDLTERADHSRVVYFSRRNAGRKVVNELEMLSIFRRVPKWADLRVVFPEFLSLPQQIRVVNDADVLILERGAGMVNSLFLKPGATLVYIDCQLGRGECNKLGLGPRDYFLDEDDSTSWMIANTGDVNVLRFPCAEYTQSAPVINVDLACVQAFLNASEFRFTSYI